MFALEETLLATTAAADRVPALDRYIDLDWGNLHANANNLREYFWSARLLEWLPLAGAVAVARRSLPVAGLLATWFATFLVVKGTTPLSTVASGSFFRFLMPSFPAYFLLLVATLLLVPTLGAQLARRWPAAQPRQVGRRALAGLAVALVSCRSSSRRRSPDRLPREGDPRRQHPHPCRQPDRRHRPTEG